MAEPSNAVRPDCRSNGSDSLAGVLTPGSAESRSDFAPRSRNRHSCSGCSTTWTALGAAHCSACHRTFVGYVLFDRHRTAAGGEHGGCLDPGRLVNASTGTPVAEFRDGMWRGPEMTEEQKVQKFGNRP